MRFIYFLCFASYSSMTSPFIISDSVPGRSYLRRDFRIRCRRQIFTIRRKSGLSVDPGRSSTDRSKYDIRSSPTCCRRSFDDPVIRCRTSVKICFRTSVEIRWHPLSSVEISWHPLKIQHQLWLAAITLIDNAMVPQLLPSPYDRRKHTLLQLQYH